MIPKLSVCICGGGSLGTVCAGIFASLGIKVNILTNHPDKWERHIKVYDPNGICFNGDLNLISDNPEECVSISDVILLCLPGFLIEESLHKIQPYLRNNTIVGSIVSSTGFFFFAKKILSNHIPIFGFQRVPFIARLKEYGHTGDLLGYKPEIKVAIENTNDKERIRKILQTIFKTNTTLLASYYEAALTNSNPILHTGRLYTMFRDFDGNPYPNLKYFYEEWDDEASQCLIEMDSEFLKLIKTLDLREGAVMPLLEYYESYDASSLTEKIKSIPAFKGISAPMIKTAEGWIPDFKSRYFTEDFPFGLRFIKNLCEQYSIDTPKINEVYKWGMGHINH